MKWENFVVTLESSERIAANLLRARFAVGGGTGPGYLPIAPGDESIAFYFSGDAEELHARTSTNPKALGGWEIVDDDRSAGHRNYTIRSYDADRQEMVVDFADHPHGPAIDWLRQAEPGWRVLAAGPRSWYAPPTHLTHHVLAGDLAALPALARILESTPDGVRVTVVAEILDRSELAYLPERADTTTIELIGGNGRSESRLATALPDLDLGDDAYCWLAGEAADTRAAKKHLRGIGWGRERYDIVGYWRANAEEWTRRFEAGADRYRKVYQDALTSGRSPEEALDYYESVLESEGL
ncbi:siderophore-interacting protein [Tsukamurella sp. 8F]|uniref:siderophore-interacting protein n=1 Tax=unclassified Tsukamurella TaxID=2633480 RepID=UPI0023B8FFBC|nr:MULTISPECIES: siderophore-interacting protein [unclassified Tsukamurella]MDF0531190.1 siderophore-interacting protein [Tsukamurella sp. 8J]MDF0585863.1 siderophore-interacting protein [Tsukamurella sp. 8F]